MGIAREAWGLVKRSIQGWLDDSGGSMGAALAFYALFSMAPLTLVAIVIAGTIFGRDQAQHLLLSQLSEVLGHRAAAGIRFLVQATANHGRVFPVAVAAVTVLIGAATVFNELKTDLDRIWRCHANRPKGFIPVLRKRLLSIAMVVGVGFLLLGSLLMSALISAVGEQVFANLELVRLAEFGGSFLVVTGLFAFIYKALPSTRIAWGDVWVGAGVTSILFWIGKVLIAVYFAHNVVGSMYGAAGAMIVLIAWVYYSAQIFFLGAEFTRQYALLHGSHQDDVDLPIAQTPREELIVERARRLVEGEDPVAVARRTAAWGAASRRRAT
jgi:membrane protein